VAPELVTDPNRSLYLTVLDGIEGRMHSAAETMLPALRHALNSFTRRADIIIRQLSYSSAGHQNRLLEICQSLAELSPEEQTARLETAGEVLASLNVALVDPAALRMHSGRVQRVVNSAVESHGEVDRGSRRNLFVQQAVETAFAVNSQAQREYVMAALSGGHRLRSQNLPVHNAKELLMSAHVIELGAAGGSSEYRFQIEATGQQVSTDYFERCDEFVIELKEQEQDNHAE
jgi:hypothetical protein